VHFLQCPTAGHWTGNISKRATRTKLLVAVRRVPKVWLFRWCSLLGDYVPRFLIFLSLLTKALTAAVSHGYFAKCQNTKGYVVQCFAKRHALSHKARECNGVSGFI